MWAAARVTGAKRKEVLGGARHVVWLVDMDNDEETWEYTTNNRNSIAEERIS